MKIKTLFFCIKFDFCSLFAECESLNNVPWQRFDFDLVREDSLDTMHHLAALRTLALNKNIKNNNFIRTIFKFS